MKPVRSVRSDAAARVDIASSSALSRYEQACFQRQAALVAAIHAVTTRKA
jgi:hypothetical protein